MSQQWVWFGWNSMCLKSITSVKMEPPAQINKKMNVTFIEYIQQMGDRKCLNLLCVCLSMSTRLTSEQKWQPYAALSYSDMTHATLSVIDGCSSFNCMSALNDGIVNSYTFHTIAFTVSEAWGGRPRLSVAIRRGSQSPCWVTGGLPPRPGIRPAADGRQAGGLM